MTRARPSVKQLVLAGFGLAAVAAVAVAELAEANEANEALRHLSPLRAHPW